MKSMFLRATALAAVLTFAPAAFAALPFGSLSFVEPTGTVGANDVIDVRVRFTLDANSSDLRLATGDLSGFLPADLPTQGQYFDPLTSTYEQRNFASVTGAQLNVFFSCDDTFSNNCNGAEPRAFTYDFHYADTLARPSAIGKSDLVLLPGQSFEYVFATFTPRAGGAPAGTYMYFNTGLTLGFTGEDADGNFLSTFGVDLGTTCSGGSVPECAFSRTVTAVPEPQTWLLMGLGLAGLAGLARRRH